LCVVLVFNDIEIESAILNRLRALDELGRRDGERESRGKRERFL